MRQIPSKESEIVRAEAAQWLGLHMSGDMGPADVDRFEAWMDETSMHAEAYKTVKTHWNLVGDLRDDPLILASRSRDAKLYVRKSLGARAVGYLGATVAALLIVGVLIGNPAFVTGEDHPLAVLVNPAVKRVSTKLSDGSIVTVDAGSEVRVTEMGAQRVLKLIRGRAFFRVAKDPSRPFSVFAAGKIVHAIGTAFDVRIDGDDVIVTLVEGKVRINESQRLFKAGSEINLAAGTQLIARSEQPWTVGNVDISREVSWHEGRLTFLGDSLASAITEVNRYSVKKLSFVDGAIPDRRIVGVFRAGDTAAFVTALELNGIARRGVETDHRIELIGG